MKTKSMTPSELATWVREEFERIKALPEYNNQVDGNQVLLENRMAYFERCIVDGIKTLAYDMEHQTSVTTADELLVLIDEHIYEKYGTGWIKGREEAAQAIAALVATRTAAAVEAARRELYVEHAELQRVVAEECDRQTAERMEAVRGEERERAARVVREHRDLYALRGPEWCALDAILNRGQSEAQAGPPSSGSVVQSIPDSAIAETVVDIDDVPIPAANLVLERAACMLDDFARDWDASVIGQSPDAALIAERTAKAYRKAAAKVRELRQVPAVSKGEEP